MDLIELLIVLVLLLWLTGNLSSYTFGGLIHLLLLIVVILIVLRLIRVAA